MTGRFTVEPLADADDRRTFDSGAEAIDRYFRELVTQDIRRRVTNCFIARDPIGTIAGYYTFAAAGLPVNELSAAEVKRLPRYPLLPAGLIGRLAVDRHFQGLGLGGALIVDAVERATRSYQAIFALVVDAKDHKAVAFYRHFGFRQFKSRPQTLFLPIASAVQLLKPR